MRTSTPFPETYGVTVKESNRINKIDWVRSGDGILGLTDSSKYSKNDLCQEKKQAQVPVRMWGKGNPSTLLWECELLQSLW